MSDATFTVHSSWSFPFPRFRVSVLTCAFGALFNAHAFDQGASHPPMVVSWASFLVRSHMALVPSPAASWMEMGVFFGQLSSGFLSRSLVFFWGFMPFLCFTNCFMYMMVTFKSSNWPHWRLCLPRLSSACQFLDVHHHDQKSASQVA